MPLPVIAASALAIAKVVPDVIKFASQLFGGGETKLEKDYREVAGFTGTYNNDGVPIGNEYIQKRYDEFNKEWNAPQQALTVEQAIADERRTVIEAAKYQSKVTGQIRDINNPGLSVAAVAQYSNQLQQAQPKQEMSFLSDLAGVITKAGNTIATITDSPILKTVASFVPSNPTAPKQQTILERAAASVQQPTVLNPTFLPGSADPVSAASRTVLPQLQQAVYNDPSGNKFTTVADTGSGMQVNSNMLLILAAIVGLFLFLRK